MALLWKKITDSYHYVNYDLADPRTREYNIILNPIIIVSLMVAYHKFVYNWGPKLMEKRQPFKLEKLLIVYNAVQIYLSGYIFYKTLDLLWFSGYYSIICQPINWDDTPREREINTCVRYYYLIKIFDLMDTIFFVLRKKYNQVSFLHVYHHLGMVLAGFVDLKYIPAGHGAMLGTINSAVHVVMYFYYFLTCFYPEYKKSIWWKKYITQIQIVQFLFLFIHFTQVLFQPNCKYPMWVSLLFLPQNLFMLVMFTDFYIKEYVKKKPKE